MRRLVVTENITVDGRIEMLDDWFDPAADAEDVQAEMQRQGAGLMAEGTTLPELSLLEASAFGGGVVLLRYALG